MRSWSAARRWIALVAVGATALGACGSDDGADVAAEVTADRPEESAAGSLDTKAPEPTEERPAPSDPASSVPVATDLGVGPIAAVAEPVPAAPELLDVALTAGFDEPTAELMAQTLSTVDVPDVHTFEVHHAFPNGAAADLTYRLVDGTGTDPAAPPTFTGEVVGDEYRFTISYAISTADLPAELRGQLLQAPLGAAGLRKTAAPSTMGVIVDGVFSQGAEGAGDQFAEFLQSKGVPGAENSFEVLKSGKKVNEALEANKLIDGVLKELAAIRKCAENPTNPVTIQAYEADPGEQQRVLDDLTAIEVDIKASAITMFTTMLGDAAGSLAKGAPWLGFITSPANNYVQTTLTAVVQDRLDQARQRASCTPVQYVASGGNPVSFSGLVADVEQPFFLAGSGPGFTVNFTFTPSGATAGTLTYSGGGSGTTLEGSGTYTIAAGPQGALAVTYENSGCASAGTCQAQTNTFTLTPVEQ